MIFIMKQVINKTLLTYYEEVAEITASLDEAIVFCLNLNSNSNNFNSETINLYYILK